MSAITREISSCRVCHSPNLEQVLDFLVPYVSDFPNVARAGGNRAPLSVVCCTDCGLPQLRHTVDPALLYRNGYWYRSGMSASMVKALGDVVAVAEAQGALSPGDRVLDIGANDGTLLSCYPGTLERWAVEPCRHEFEGQLARVADHVEYDFWPPSPDESDVTFKAITSIACFYDVDDPHAFVQAIKRHLAEDGVWIVQLQDEQSILMNNAIDYWCHEHLCLYSTATMASLLSPHGLRIRQAEVVPVNGGSLRFVIEHSKLQPAYLRWQDNPGAEWRHFGAMARERRRQALDLLRWLKIQGKLVLGVAASTKANTLLQYYGIDSELIPAVVERAPEKIGRFTVGTDIPIISEEQAAALQPDYYVVLAWHLLDGLRARSPSTPFISLLPEVNVWAPLEQRTVARANSSA